MTKARRDRTGIRLTSRESDTARFGSSSYGARASRIGAVMPVCGQGTLVIGDELDAAQPPPGELGESHRVPPTGAGIPLDRDVPRSSRG